MVSNVNEVPYFDIDEEVRDHMLENEDEVDDKDIAWSFAGDDNVASDLTTDDVEEICVHSGGSQWRRR